MAAEEVADAARLLQESLSAAKVIVRNQQQTGIVAVGSPQEASSFGAQPQVIHRRISSIAAASQAGGEGRPTNIRSMNEFVTRAQENFR